MPIGCGVVAAFLLVALDDVDHPVLPLGRVAPLRRLVHPEEPGELLVDAAVARRLVGDLPEHVRQVVERVDDLPDVRLLDRLDLRVERQDLEVVDRRAR